MGFCDYWHNTSEINVRYHDEEWGVPVHDDRTQFEYLTLEVMQCGLSWQTIINKRDIMRSCFANFDFSQIATYDEGDILRIMNTAGMIKSRRKITAIINNARCFMQICHDYGSFCNYIWQYSSGKTILYTKHDEGYIPVSNGLSAEISRDLRRRGFKYLGAVTIYSHLQACGIINDHAKDCPRYAYINSNFPVVRKKRYLEQQVKYFK